MPCPYLSQVTMAFCRACPQRVYVPSDRIRTASSCEGECYQQCPVYRESLEAALRALRANASHKGAGHEPAA